MSVLRCTVRDHVISPQHGLDRVKLSIQKGPLGSFDRADGELLARLWNEHNAQGISAGTAEPAAQSQGEARPAEGFGRKKPTDWRKTRGVR